MKQLELFPEQRQVSIRILPQPTQGGGIFRGDWQWPYSHCAYVCTSDPCQSALMVQHSPFQANDLYGDHLISRVQVCHTRSRGWVWVLTLKEYDEDDLPAVWDLLSALRRPEVKPPKLVCQHCRSDELVVMLPAMTAYHSEPGEDRNPPLILCKECREDYQSYWTERWNEYYAGLL